MIQTSWLWARYDLCSKVNAQVNSDWRGAPEAAIAERKRVALAEAGVPAADMEITLYRQVAAPSGWTVLLVRDEIARWVLRPDASSPETMPKSGVVLETQEKGAAG